jgi:hypothetical protein
LLHPLDLLDHRDAPGLEFFPGMAMRAEEKIGVVRAALEAMGRHFQIVGTAEHAHRLAQGGLRRHRPATTAGPRQSRLPGAKA